ncbi:uncharacterized protein LOC130717381 [Lotus japonicus]|uniref:uncharacterized protein LOC130717381 n=1 Tax=Lotus japonicus TaxID=34305 RepID=UPI0025840210|nr:uncharacterized protein LOC130717381 [Lotus japonicus]XP_057423578.1 uncharacterized protein LOC130717381 [Lotus japonicus]
METKSTSVSETNPLSNLSFDEILALADDAWAQSTSLPGIDDGVKSHSGAGDPLHVSLEQQHSINHESSLDPQDQSRTLNRLLSPAQSQQPSPTLIVHSPVTEQVERLTVENHGYDKPNPGCVHLLVHFAGKRGGTKPLLNVDINRYSYLGLVDDVGGLAMADGCNAEDLPFTLSFSHPSSQSKKSINTDADVLDMFKLNAKCEHINVYATLLNYEDREFGVSNFDKAMRNNNHEMPEVIVIESDDECRMGDEPEEDESEETDGSIYLDKGMKGKISVHEADGKVKLKVGLLFVDVDEFRATLKNFVIQEGFQVQMIKNEKARVTAICSADGCLWCIHASLTTDGKTFKIQTFNPLHSCIRTSKNSNATSTWTGKKSRSKFKADPNVSSNQELLDNYGIEPSNLAQLYRARKRVRQDSNGVHALRYTGLSAWANLAKETNPGSIIKLQLEPRINKNPEFKRFFVCLDAMKKGFVRGCRPWFGIDGCHLKGQYGGVLLSAVAVDGNKDIFPIAFAVVEVECKGSWMFFLSLLNDALSSVPEWQDIQVTIMSDMENGLRNSVAEKFPYAKHRYCCNHLLNNFKLNFKTLLLNMQFWVAAMAYNEFMYEKAMDKLRKINIEAANWLLDPERPKNMWARHTIDPKCKSDHVTNNICETFNSWLGDDTEKTILSMIESITCRLMGRFQRRYERGRGFQNIITPKIRKGLYVTMQDGRFCRVLTYAGNEEFLVKDGHTIFLVKLRNRECGCNYWGLSGLPCKHACACIAYKGENVEMFCDDAYTTRTYCLAYTEIIHPIPELDPGNSGCYGKIDSPTLKRLPGWERINRKRGVTEGPTVSHEARRSHRVKCANCEEFGHDSWECQRDKSKRQEKVTVRSGKHNYVKYDLRPRREHPTYYEGDT